MDFRKRVAAVVLGLDAESLRETLSRRQETQPVEDTVQDVVAYELDRIAKDYESRFRDAASHITGVGFTSENEIRRASVYHEVAQELKARALTLRSQA